MYVVILACGKIIIDHSLKRMRRDVEASCGYARCHENQTLFLTEVLESLGTLILHLRAMEYLDCTEAVYQGVCQCLANFFHHLDLVSENQDLILIYSEEWQVLDQPLELLNPFLEDQDTLVDVCIHN